MSSSSQTPLAKLFAFLSSFGLATFVLAMLLVITFLGTLEQAEFGLVASQARYFESFFVDRIDIGACWRALALNAYADIGNVTLPMPLGFVVRPQAVYTLLWSFGVFGSLAFLFKQTILPTLQGKQGMFGTLEALAAAGLVLLVGMAVAQRSLLPGGYTLMAALFVNMLLGGIVRIRKSPKTIGVIISHFAILFMIAAGAVSYHFAKEGSLELVEGKTSDEFRSFHERVIEIQKVPAEREKPSQVLVIGDEMFRDLSGAKKRTFTHESLPFDLTITAWKKHAQPKSDADGSRADNVDGYYIQELSTLDEAGGAMADEGLASACIAIVKDKKSGEEQKGILWEFEAAPWTVTIEGSKYVISLDHRTYKLPFAIRLDETEQEKHPGTERARRFTSKVTKITGDHEEKRVITMNEPVRSEGYAVFQQTFDDGTRSGSGVKRSGFQIVENPSDHWPLISCIIVAEGLLLHFLMMLARFIKAEPWKFSIGLILVFNAAFALAMWKLL